MAIARKKSYHLIYFILQPFFTLLYYIYNFRKPAAKNVMWLFTIFYGATFAIGTESEGSDINRYIDEIPFVHSLGLDFSFQSFVFYYGSTGEFDILRSVLAFTVSYFTDNGYYLIVVYGAIFGYFYSRNMWYVMGLLKGRLKKFTVFLLFCLFLTVPIWEMNGFRFWTGAHVFVYGLLPFLFEGKRKSLIWCFLTPFVFHYSFLSALAPIFAYLVLGNRIRLYYIVFVMSLIFSELNIEYFNKVVENYAPTALVERSSSYRDPDLIDLREAQAKEKQKAWYAKYYKDITKYVLIAFMFVFYRVHKRFRRDDVNLGRLLGFVLLFFAFANVFSSIPSGQRFMRVCYLLVFSFLAIYYQNNKVHVSISNMLKTTWPLLLLPYVVIFRMSWYSFSLMTIIGNPMLAFYSFAENLALNDIIKSMFS